MNYDSARELLRSHSQEHILDDFHTLDEPARARLLAEIGSLDFEELRRMRLSAAAPAREYAPAQVFSPESADPALLVRAREKGEALLRGGKVAAFIVAGGQGSRLGFEGPKGAFSVSPVRDKSIFRLHAEKVVAASRKYAARIPLLVMTSQANNQDTEAHFRASGNFGLPEDDLLLFPQRMIPSLDTEGKLILAAPGTLFRNPDGHGGSLAAIAASGVLDALERRGIEYLSYIQVDNPLVRIIDPLFLGMHVIAGSTMSSKAIVKAYPEEKLGLFVRYADGGHGIMEYSDMPDDALHASENGVLSYRWGNTGVHIFSVAFIRELTGSVSGLPYHEARKKIRAWRGGAYHEIEGCKYEKFVFDAIPLARNPLIFECRRDEEFAPVKNAEGVDSPESCRRLMSGLHRQWLERRGYAVPESVRAVEISPLAALEADDLPAGLALDWTERVYIGND
jgi:UDP-N-acetylglucosamine/UDP-N-acetylgalactosamine diphosphorylase